VSEAGADETNHEGNNLQLAEKVLRKKAPFPRNYYIRLKADG